MTENVRSTITNTADTSDSTCTTCTSHFTCNNRTNGSYRHRTMNVASVTGSEATSACQQQQQQDFHRHHSVCWTTKALQVLLIPPWAAVGPFPWSDADSMYGFDLPTVPRHSCKIIRDDARKWPKFYMWKYHTIMPVRLPN